MAALARSASARGWRAAVVNPFALDAATEFFERLYEPVPYFEHRTAASVDCSLLAAGPLPCCPSWRHASSMCISTTPLYWRPRCALPRCTLAAKSPLRCSLRPRGPARFSPPGPVVGPPPRPGSGGVRAARDYLVGRCGLGEDEVTVVHNGWSGRPREAPLSASPPTVVCVANFRPEKGHDVLVRAFSEVVRAVPTARLMLAGTGRWSKGFRQEVVRHGISESVVFCGSLTEVWNVLAQGDVFALASSYEGLGLAVIEAMAAGLPVVATAVGGLAELVRPGRSGWLVPAGDHAEMARRITHLLTDGPTRRRFWVRTRSRRWPL